MERHSLIFYGFARAFLRDELLQPLSMGVAQDWLSLSFDESAQRKNAQDFAASVDSLSLCVDFPPSRMRYPAPTS